MTQPLNLDGVTSLVEAGAVSAKANLAEKQAAYDANPTEQTTHDLDVAKSRVRSYERHTGTKLEV
jgi:hypothetical protein